MPAYDFKCDTCGRVHEVRIKFADYDTKKDSMQCWEFGEEKPGCQGKLKRMMDFSGHFQLNGSGWFGRGGEGTGYEITQNEMDNNLDDSARMEEDMQKFMHESQKYEDGE